MARLPVQTIEVEQRFDGMKLDKWLQAIGYHIPFGMLSKWCRKGEMRVDKGRVNPKVNVETGQMVRLPPFDPDDFAKKQAAAKPKINADQAVNDLTKWTLYDDQDLLVINKPAGLAVQGGSGVKTSVDDMISAYGQVFDCKPRLTHRIDKDTSGILVIAKTAQAATALTTAFHQHDISKTYWALTHSKPQALEGKITAPLGKPQGKYQKVQVLPKNAGGQTAISHYTLKTYHKKLNVGWLVLQPQTGRTHQLRVHCASVYAPILGDGKYGGKASHPKWLKEAYDKLHLHARAIVFDHPMTGKSIEIVAPLSDAMAKTWHYCGFEI